MESNLSKFLRISDPFEAYLFARQVMIDLLVEEAAAELESGDFPLE